MTNSTDRATFLPVTNEIVSTIVAGQCRSNRDFLSLIRNDPREAFRQLLDHQFDDDAKIRVVQNTRDEFNICVPAYEGMSKAVLGEEDMKSISGGEVIFSIIGGMIALAAVGTGIGLAAGLGVSQQQGRLRHLGIEPETLPAP